VGSFVKVSTPPRIQWGIFLTLSATQQHVRDRSTEGLGEDKCGAGEADAEAA
jgi:hypothetical protein